MITQVRAYIAEVNPRKPVTKLVSNEEILDENSHPDIHESLKKITHIIVIDPFSRLKLEAKY